MENMLIEKRSELRQKIMTMEWDKKLNQINFSKEQMLKDYKKELEEIELALNKKEIHVNNGQII